MILRKKGALYYFCYKLAKKKFFLVLFSPKLKKKLHNGISVIPMIEDDSDKD